MNIKELQQKLPKCWDNVTVSIFQKIGEVTIHEDTLFAGISNTIELLSKLLDISTDELENLSLQDIATLGESISFISKHPQVRNKKDLFFDTGKASNIKLKKLEEVSYDSFVLMVNTDKESNQFIQNIHNTLAPFTADKLTPEEILKLPILDALNGFFLLMNMLDKYINHSNRLTNFQSKVKVKHLMGMMESTSK